MRMSVILRGVALVTALIVFAVAFGPGDSVAGFGAMFPERRAAAAFSVAFVIAAMTLPTRWLERIVPAVTMTVISVAIGEAALRLTVGEQYATTIELDEKRLFRLAPGTSKMVSVAPVNGGDKFRVVVDSLGNRRSSDGRVAAAGDILVVGDSFIEGETTLDTLTFAEQFQRRLAPRASTPMHVVNGGVIGYGPDQVLLRIEAELPRVRPRLLVVGVFAGNDFGDLQRNRLFRLDSTRHLVRRQAVVSPELVAQIERGKARWIFAKLIFRIRNAPEPVRTDDAASSDAKSLAFVEQWMRDRHSESNIATDDTLVTNLFEDTPDVDVAAEPDAPEVTRKRELLLAVLDSIGRFAASRDVPVVFVLIPSAIDVLDKYEGGRIDTVRFPHYDRAGVTGKIAERLRANGRSVIDLFGPFRESTTRLYLRGDDNHWNAEGQALAATIVADSVAPWLFHPDSGPVAQGAVRGAVKH